MFSADARRDNRIWGVSSFVQEPTATSARPGFGAAHLMGSVGTWESTHLVHASLDSGIAHFDTARVYVLGDAEQMLGVAPRGRPGVSADTKAGQGNPPHSRLPARLHAAAGPVTRAWARLLRLRFETQGRLRDLSGTQTSCLTICERPLGRV